MIYVLGLLAAAVILWFLWRSGFQRALDAGMVHWRSITQIGQWRPVAAMLVVFTVGGAVILALRGQWMVALPLLATALWSGLFVRRDGIRDEGREPAPPVISMARTEAAALLGVSTDASAEEVTEAYRRLMRRAHPDSGGTQGLAAQLNAAREVLLSPR